MINRPLINKVHLRITSDKWNAAEISEYFGVKSDTHYDVGDVIALNIKSEATQWWLSVTGTSEPEKLLEELIDRLEPLKEKLKSLPEEHEKMISFEVQNYGDPEYYFSKEIIKKLADLEVSFWIDQYIFPEEENEDEGWIYPDENGVYDI